MRLDLSSTTRQHGEQQLQLPAFINFLLVPLQCGVFGEQVCGWQW
ncbi:hypothetical protein RO575_04750 [Methylomonas sp. MO1]|nr:hypothetical protein [Methylomonas sp. MO1]MDT4288855.1 hypothetical protein [Methylomonas sp. MO1]